MTDLVLVARGTERLEWMNRAFSRTRDENACAHLMAGSPIDLDSNVIYGIRGKQATPAQTHDETSKRAAGRRSNDPIAGRIRIKMQRLQTHMRRRGRPTADFQRTMQAFQRHMRAVRRTRSRSRRRMV